MLRMVKVGVQFVPKELNHPEVDLTCASTATRQRRRVSRVLDYLKGTMGIEKRLNEAAEAREVITVVYHGGSQPGTKRRLSPIKATPSELRARDIATDEVKTFLV